MCFLCATSRRPSLGGVRCKGLGLLIEFTRDGLLSPRCAMHSLQVLVDVDSTAEGEHHLRFVLSRGPTPAARVFTEGAVPKAVCLACLPDLPVCYCQWLLS